MQRETMIIPLRYNGDKDIIKTINGLIVQGPYGSLDIKLCIAELMAGFSYTLAEAVESMRETPYSALFADMAGYAGFVFANQSWIIFKTENGASMGCVSDPKRRFFTSYESVDEAIADCYANHHGLVYMCEDLAMLIDFLMTIRIQLSDSSPPEQCTTAGCRACPDSVEYTDQGNCTGTEQRVEGDPDEECDGCECADCLERPITIHIDCLKLFVGKGDGVSAEG
jgi:hypothetical protein